MQTSIEQLFDLVEPSVRGEIGDVEVAYHEEPGYPLGLHVDYAADAIDDEVMYRAADVAPQD